MMKRATLARDESALGPDEQKFLKRARELFVENTDWLQFEDFAFGSRSPLFARNRSQQDVLTHPLYTALKEMWLELGVKQGRIAAPSGGSQSDAARRTTRRRG